MATAEGHLLTLRDQPDATDAMQACFRSLHTVKGGAGFLGQNRIQTLAHATEQILDALRSGATAVTRERIDAILDATTRLQALVQALAGSPAVVEDDAALVSSLVACLAEGEDYAPAAPGGVGGEPTTRREQRQSHGPSGIDGILKRFRHDDIPGMIERLAEARRALVGQSSGIQEALTRLDGFCDRLVLEQAGPDPDQTLARLTAELSARLAEQPRPLAAAVQAGISANPAAIDEALAEIIDLLAMSESAVIHDNPGASEAAIRAVHSIKGIAATVGLDRLTRLAQAVESELEPLRQGTALTPSVRTLVLGSLDGLGELAAAAKEAGAELGPWPRTAAAVATRLGVTVDVPPEAMIDARLVQELLDVGVPEAEVAAAARSLQPGEDLTSRLVKTGRITPAQATQAQVQVQAKAAQQVARQDTFARVSTARLEELVDLIGELLITQAGVMQHAAAAPPELRNAIIRQGRTVRELQVIALGLRMVPIKGIFQKMARAVLDTARKLGKEIDFTSEGEDTELDRNLAETLADPLLHMVRNAADHGVEEPAARRAAGKAEKGRITLSARHAGEHILVELRDDGRGMDPDRLVAKAKEKGLLPLAAAPTREEAFNLIFAPGFSTAAQVTEVSGRGVGMDVVKRNVDSLRGRIEIDSQLGKGTTFTLRLPLTTAVLDAMVLRVANQRFLVPVAMVVEALKPEAGQVQALAGHRGRVVQSRGRWLPVIQLAERCGVSGARDLPEDGVLVVLEHLSGRLAIQVDEIMGLQQAVIKPLPPDFPHDPGVAGTAILGDGHVGLILEPTHLAAAS